MFGNEVTAGFPLKMEESYRTETLTFKLQTPGKPKKKTHDS
jgi:hypothetical protein